MGIAHPTRFSLLLALTTIIRQSEFSYLFESSARSPLTIAIEVSLNKITSKTGAIAWRTILISFVCLKLN